MIQASGKRYKIPLKLFDRFFIMLFNDGGEGFEVVELEFKLLERFAERLERF